MTWMFAAAFFFGFIARNLFCAGVSIGAMRLALAPLVRNKTARHQAAIARLAGEVIPTPGPGCACFFAADDFHYAAVVLGNISVM
ncbi:MAG: hypothetical protein PF501_19115 [Salinisphaera sp.]|nr:hypothetical protein [Salinisphaera sp.]